MHNLLKISLIGFASLASGKIFTKEDEKQSYKNALVDCFGREI